MTALFISLIFGSIGMGYFIYGKKQQEAVPMIAGFMLCIYPYFTDNAAVMVIAGLCLMALPWIWR